MADLPAAPERAPRVLTAPDAVTVVELGEATDHVLDGVTAYLAQLPVSPAYRGGGLGRRLIGEFATRAGSPSRIDLLPESDAGLDAELPHRRYHGFRVHLST